MNAGRWTDAATRAVQLAARSRRFVPPVALVLAVIERESRGDPNAFNPEGSGADPSRGLMQVRDSTARELGFAPSDMRDPSRNVLAGTLYLAKQLDRYGGSIPRAVAAYNAGAARYDERERFVNQGYVNDVLGLFYEFARRLPARGAVAGGLAAIALAVAAAIALGSPSPPRRGW